MNSTTQDPSPARRAGMTTYVDGSAVTRRIAERQGSDVARDVWDRAEVVATSAIAYLEARVALADADRGDMLDEAGSQEAASALEQVFADATTVIAIDAELAIAAGELAEQHGLAAPDALHLAAALSIPAPRVVVATWSEPLAVAAAEHGMAVVPRPPARVAA